MSSPFPGMDPYIEECGLWGDFHNSLIHEMKKALARAVPKHYFLRTVERSYVVLIESEGKDSHPFLADISVSTPRGRKKGGKKGGVAEAEPRPGAAPFTLRAFIEEEHREHFVEIYESAPEHRLVTSIEVLSPSNKRPGTVGWEQYHRKRQSHLLGDVHFVEIDLLRGGTRMLMFDPWPDSPYVLMVAKARRPQRCDVWPGHFREPLPTILVPLAKPDAAIPLALQPLVNEVYEDSNYDQSIDYTKPLTPPLAAADAAWLKQQLKAKAKP